MRPKSGQRGLIVALAAGLLVSVCDRKWSAHAQPPASTTVVDDIKQEISGVVRGQVIGQDGKPAAKVDVWAAWSETGIRETRYTRHTVTDAEGKYQLDNILIRSGVTIRPPTTITLIATHDGVPPAVLTAFATKTRDAVAPEIRIASQEGTLSVTVLDKSGGPAAGVSVEATATAYKRDAPSGAVDYFRFHDKDYEALRRALVPRVVTDANGVARFTHLRPDRYQIVAARFPRGTNLGTLSLVPGLLQVRTHGNDSAFAAVEQVAVTAGEAAQSTLRLENMSDIKSRTPPAQ